jgi:transcription antitermination factor NusG
MPIMPLDATMPECVATPDSRNDPACIRVGQPRWAVLATYPQSEAWAESNLRQRGYTPFLPRYTARIRDRTTPTLTRIVERPLFPGYIFCQHDPRDPWRPIRYCPGIRANLIGGLGVQYARAGDISVLEASEALRRTPTTPGSLWRPGAPCQPRDGPFQGLPAVVIEVERQIAKVAIVMFGELRQVSVDVSSLVARE